MPNITTVHEQQQCHFCGSAVQQVPVVTLVGSFKAKHPAGVSFCESCADEAAGALKNWTNDRKKKK